MGGSLSKSILAGSLALALLSAQAQQASGPEVAQATIPDAPQPAVFDRDVGAAGDPRCTPAADESADAGKHRSRDRELGFGGRYGQHCGRG